MGSIVSPGGGRVQEQDLGASLRVLWLGVLAESPELEGGPLSPVKSRPIQLTWGAPLQHMQWGCSGKGECPNECQRETPFMVLFVDFRAHAWEPVRSQEGGRGGLPTGGGIGGG